MKSSRVGSAFPESVDGSRFEEFFGVFTLNDNIDCVSLAGATSPLTYLAGTSTTWMMERGNDVKVLFISSTLDDVSLGEKFCFDTMINEERETLKNTRKIPFLSDFKREKLMYGKF